MYVHVYIIQITYIDVYTCTYTVTSERCTYMFMPLNVHTMYVPCTDTYIQFQKCINMYIHVVIENDEMIGEREIDVLLLPEMSRAERARRAKKNEQFPLSCPQAAPPRRGGAIGRSSSVATLEGKSLCITGFSLYPASRVSGRGPAGLGKPKLLLMFIHFKKRIYHVRPRTY